MQQTVYRPIMACVLICALAGCDRPAPVQGNTAAPSRAASSSTAPISGPSPAKSSSALGDYASDILTCAYPVRGDDTAKSLKQRFGNQARVETINGAEGIEMKALILWPDDPLRRVQVGFSDDAMTQNPALSVVQEKFVWRVAGLGRGADIAAVNAVNGRPVSISGFGWDYGGFVTDWRGGKLANLDGGCHVDLHLSPPDVEVPRALMGEVTLRSDDPRVLKVAPIIDTIGLGWRKQP